MPEGFEDHLRISNVRSVSGSVVLSFAFADLTGQSLPILRACRAWALR
jgi:hypothetical protein